MCIVNYFPDESAIPSAPRTLWIQLTMLGGVCSSGSILYVCGVLKEGPVGAFPAQPPSASSRRVPCHLPGHSAQIRSCCHLPECSLMACHFHFQPVRQSFRVTDNGCEPPRIT